MLVLGVDVRKQSFAVQLRLVELEGDAEVEAVEGVQDLHPVTRQVEEASNDVTGAESVEKRTRVRYFLNWFHDY